MEKLKVWMGEQITEEGRAPKRPRRSNPVHAEAVGAADAIPEIRGYCGASQPNDPADLTPVRIALYANVPSDSAGRSNSIARVTTPPAR